MHVCHYWILIQITHTLGQPKGILHRAFSVMLFDSVGKVLLSAARCLEDHFSEGLDQHVLVLSREVSTGHDLYSLYR